MSIDDLTHVVSPPRIPVEAGSSELWSVVQKQLKKQLPDDMRDFAMVYGSGVFSDVGKIGLIIYNPFSPKYQETILEDTSILQAFKDGEGDEYIPYPVYPKKSGLLPIGQDDNGNQLLWLTKGKQDEWPILVRSHSDDDFQRFDGPLTSFLAKVFTGEIRVNVWPAPFFEDVKNIRFEPGSTVSEAPEPTTLYELYHENGDKAGFWARNNQPFQSYFVKKIDGAFEGPLRGIPIEYDRQPVELDVYFHGKLCQIGVDLGNAFMRIWTLLPQHPTEQMSPP